MPVAAGPVVCVPQLSEAARLHPQCPSPTHRQTFPRPDDTGPATIGRPDSFAYACDASGPLLPTLCTRGYSRSTPAGLHPFGTPPHLRPLSSTGITPRLQSYGPLRHPASPACPSRGSGCRVHGTDWASRVATPSTFHTCRRHYPGGNRPVLVSLTSQPVGGLPLTSGGSSPALHVSRPAQRSLHVSARMVTEPPKAALLPESFSPCRYLHKPLWLLPAEATVAGRDSHPLGKCAFPRHTDANVIGFSPEANAISTTGVKDGTILGSADFFC